MRFVKERERIIQQIYTPVLLLTMNFVTDCQSSVRIYSAIASWIHSYFHSVRTKFVISNRTDTWNVNFIFRNIWMLQWNVLKGAGTMTPPVHLTGGVRPLANIRLCRKIQMSNWRGSISYSRLSTEMYWQCIQTKNIVFRLQVFCRHTDNNAGNLAFNRPHGSIPIKRTK